MPVKLSGSFEQAAVFYAGERLTLTVTLSNTFSDDPDRDDVPVERSKVVESASMASIAHSTTSFSPANLLTRKPSLRGSSTALDQVASSHGRQSQHAPSRSSISSYSTDGSSSSHSVSDGSEHFLFGSVQVIGHFNIDTGVVRPEAFESIRHKGAGILGKQEWPIFVNFASLLFVNLTLMPGELHTYQIMLPLALPPTHRGRLFKTTYRALVKIQPRSAVHAPLQLVLPFRLFSAIEDDGHALVYDLMEPIVSRKDEARVVCLEEASQQAKVKRSRSQAEKLSLIKQMEEVNLSDNEDTGRRSPLPHPQESPADRIARFENGGWARKVTHLYESAGTKSFDVSKDDQRIGQLRFHKSIYRLGDNLGGVLDLSNGMLPCYHISLWLESEEVVEHALSFKTASTVSKLSTRQWSELHENVQNTRRLPIALSIPRFCAPSFATTGVSLRWSVRVELIVKRTSAPPPAGMFTVKESDQDFAHFDGRQQLDVDVFSFCIPLNVLPQPYPLYNTREEASLA
ncbi:Golgi membrane exchange factor (Ric1p-Rgp1p) subunit [Sorochytrium milnesiophthora]